MTEIYRRRVRIEAKPGELKGYMVNITDEDTKETIPHVFAIDIHLHATAVSTADITYYETNPDGKIAIKDGEPVVRSRTVESPIVDVTAMETMSEIEQLRAEIEMHRAANRQRAIDRRVLGGNNA